MFHKFYRFRWFISQSKMTKKRKGYLQTNKGGVVLLERATLFQNGSSLTTKSFLSIQYDLAARLGHQTFSTHSLIKWRFRWMVTKCSISIYARDGVFGLSPNLMEWSSKVSGDFKKGTNKPIIKLSLIIRQSYKDKLINIKDTFVMKCIKYNKQLW